jgi:cytochrome d ubiquinol oxidase subunit I
MTNLIHLSFNAMVAIGMGLVLLSAWQAWWWRFHRRVLMTRWFLLPAALAGAAATVAMEAGWIVTEVGRQPWVVYRLLRTQDAVTTASGVPVTLAAVLLIYAVLSGVVVVVPLLMSRRWRQQETPPAGEVAPAGPVPPASRRPVG